MCVSLTSTHVRFRGLRSEDGDSYRRYMRRLPSTGQETSSIQMCQQKESRARRHARIARQFGTTMLKSGITS